MSKNINMTEGPIFPEIVRYTVPIILGTVLQILFNSADLAIVGNFSRTGTAAAAAVGATGTIVTLIVNLFMGISIGVNIILSRSIGSNDREKSQRIVHTAVLMGVILGFAACVIGLVISKPALIWTKCPEASFDMAVDYLRIYFLGAPAMLVYNFVSAVMRTNGDTKRPLYFLILAGVINVLLNLLFVCVFHMEAAGVALATAITQYIPAALAVRCLVYAEDETRLYIRNIRMYRREALEIIRYGLPTGISEVCMSVAGMQLQTALNAYDISAVNGASIVGNINGYFGAITSAIHAATVAFVGRNIGAGNRKRVIKCFLVCIAFSTVSSGIIGNVVFLFARPLIGLFNTKDPAVAEYGIQVASVLFRLFFITGLRAPITGTLQAFEKSSYAMIDSLIFFCIFKIVWIKYVYPLNPSLEFLYLSAPLSSAMTAIVELTMLFFIFRKFLKAETEK